MSLVICISRSEVLRAGLQMWLTGIIASLLVWADDAGPKGAQRWGDPSGSGQRKILDGSHCYCIPSLPACLATGHLIITGFADDGAHRLGR